MGHHHNDDEDENSGSGSERDRSRSRSRSHNNRNRSRSKSTHERHSHGHSHTHSHSSSKKHDRSPSRSHRHYRSRSHSDDHEMDTLKKYWKQVKENSSDFDGWTRLLQFVEQLDETKSAREAYDVFLSRYPYCYGYWRKYAELERRHKHYERSIEVYERGVRAIELSVDLWLHYLSFIKEISQNEEGAIQKTRLIYERAIEACGMEFRSDKLWQEYIEWELNNGETEHVGALYDRLLSIPTLQYNSHFEKYQTFVNSYEPDRILSTDEYKEIYSKVEEELRKVVDGELYIDEEFIDDTPPDFIADNGEEPPRRMIKRRKHCEEALRLMRHKIIERRRQKYLKNEEEVSRRWTFEENIKRPYFHVKPLERTQLRNWMAYLDFEIERGDPKRILILFERCLIACAMYDDMWIKYARYMSSIKEVERARNIYHRATTIHLPSKLNIHLAYSAFEEEYGNFDEALRILADFDHRHPHYAIVSLRRIGIERRLAIANAAINGGSVDYSTVISRFERLIQDTQTPRRLATFYAIKLARFHARTRNDRKLAEKILLDALNRDKDSAQVYLALIDLAYSAPIFDEKAILHAFDNAINCEYLSNEDKLKFSQRKLDFLEDLGSDIKKLQKHLEYHSHLQKTVENTPTSSKRKSDHLGKGDHPEKRAYPAVTTYSVPYVPQQQQQQQPQQLLQPQQQYFITAPNDATFATTTIPQQQTPVMNAAFYYAPQPSNIQIQPTY